MVKRLVVLIAAVILLATIVVTAVFSLQPAENQNPENTYGKQLHYTLSYSYCFDGDPYVSPKTQQVLEDWGKIEYITRAEPKVQTQTQIPAFENDAKGIHPAYIFFPELNDGDYKSCDWQDKSTGMSVSGCYRMVGGMTTDEVIKVYVDASGDIVKCETVNLGKYDALGLDGAKLESLRSAFTDRVVKKMRAVISCHSPAMEEQTVYRLFTDEQGRLVITTTMHIEQTEPYAKTLEVELYAVVK